MRIYRLTAQNIKNLKSVDITPPADGSAVIIRGKNGAGKSATLDSIGMAIANDKLERPIRQGQDHAEVSVVLDDYVVQRRWTAKSGPNGSLKVMSKEGAVFKSPQALMDRIRGKIGFDPHDFARLTGRQQVDLLKSLDPNLDFAETDALRMKIYEERTIVNRQLRDVEGELKNLPPIPEGLPAIEISMQAKLTAIQNLQDQTQQYRNWCKDLELAQTRAAAFDNSVEIMQGKLRDLQVELAETMGYTQTAREEVRDIETLKPYLPAQSLIDESQHELHEVEVTNAAIRQAAVTAKAAARKIELDAKGEELTKGIEDIDTAKAKTIAGAKYPIDGLAIAGDEVLYKGIPFGQLASSEQIRVSTAIGMALNPTLKVLCVHDGSLLDDASLAAIQEQCKAGDYQLWIECVGEGGVGILIEEGMVKSCTEQPQLPLG